MVRLRWIGPGVIRRVVGEFVWGPETGFVQDVPAALAEELLTAPGEQFEVVTEAGLGAETG